MANLIGEGFNDYVRKQINNRQKVYGSGANSGRTEKEITYLNSRTAWIKVASSVSISDKDKKGEAVRRLKSIGLNEESLKGKGLAKAFVLFNGVSSLNKDQGSTLKQREGIRTTNVGSPSNPFAKTPHNSAYGMGGLDFGQQPMPGITKLDVQAINMGSLKKATISLKAYNKDQLALLDVLYLRLGYTLLVEYGNNLYLDKNGKVKNMGSTIVEEKFFSDKLTGKSYRDLLPEIEKKRLEYCGNYDAFFGRITNYSWDYNPDGSYDIQINLYSLGDVIESLKLNQVNTQGLLTKYQNSTDDQKKHMAARFKLQYGGENIEAFLQQEERKKNKIFEYLEEVRQFSFMDKTKQIPIKRAVDFQKSQKAAVIDAQQSSTSWNVDNTNNDVVSKGKQYELQMQQDQKYEEISNFQLYPPITASDGTVYHAQPLPQNLNGIKLQDATEEVEVRYYKEVLPISQDPNLDKTFAPSQPGYTREQIEDLGADIKEQTSQANKNLLIGDYNNKSTTSDFKTVEFKSSFNGEEFTVELFAFEDDFLLTEDYVGSQILMADRLTGQDLSSLDSFQQQTLTLNSFDPYASISYMTDGDDYTIINNINVGNLGTDSQFFDPRLPLQDIDTSPKNMVPFPSPVDLEILDKNNNIIYAEQQRIRDKQAKAAGVDPPSSKKTTPTIKTNRVSYKITPFKQSSNVIEIGKVINFRDGWDLSQIYKPFSPTSDHINIKEYKPQLQSYFIRFGTLLEFIKDKIMYKIDNGGSKVDNSSMFLLDTDMDSNVMYTLPNHISLDPTQAIVNVNVKSIGSNIQTFEGLEEFQNKKPFYGKIMNIYLSHGFIEEQMSANTDENGNLILFNFLDSVCTRLNVIFGGVNNLHPSIDETTNCLKIYDDTPIPNIQGIVDFLREKDPVKYKFFEDVKNFQWNCNTLPNTTVPYTLNLYGYKGTSNVSNFVNDVKIKTKVTKDMATMLSIGATANGYVVGEESTAFSKWNAGMIDRYYEEIVDAEYDEKIKAEIAARLRKENEEIMRNYYFNIFYNFEDSTRRYYNGAYEIVVNKEEVEGSAFSRFNQKIIKGTPPPEAETKIEWGGGTVLPFQIEQNISAGTSFYQFLIASASATSNSDKPVANIQGFLPITLDISLDGISGPKIYQKLEVDTSFLPGNYPDAMEFIIRGVNHSLQDNSWNTSFQTIATSQLANEPVLLEEINFDISVFNKALAPTEEMNPYPNATTVKNFQTNSYPLIVQSEEHKEAYIKEYGSNLGSDFDNFVIRAGEGNPDSFTEKFRSFLSGKPKRLIIKQKELGNGADISEDLFEALKRFHNALGGDRYAPYLPIIITAGNDAFHHGPTLTPSSKYPTSKVFPFNTTHTRGLAIDIRQDNPANSDFEFQRNLAIQDALWEAGFKGIIWHSPPHIHANISTIEEENPELSTASVGRFPSISSLK